MKSRLLASTLTCLAICVVFMRYIIDKSVQELEVDGISMLELPGYEFLILNIFLIIAGLVIVAFVSTHVIKHKSHFLIHARALILYFGFIWSGSVALADAFNTNAAQALHSQLAEELKPHIKDHSVIFAIYADATWILIGKIHGLILLNLAIDNYQDFEKLIDLHSSEGREIYFFAPKEDIELFAINLT